MGDFIDCPPKCPPKKKVKLDRKDTLVKEIREGNHYQHGGGFSFVQQDNEKYPRKQCVICLTSSAKITNTPKECTRCEIRCCNDCQTNDICILCHTRSEIWRFCDSCLHNEICLSDDIRRRRGDINCKIDEFVLQQISENNEVKAQELGIGDIICETCFRNFVEEQDKTILFVVGNVSSKGAKMLLFQSVQARDLKLRGLSDSKYGHETNGTYYTEPPFGLNVVETFKQARRRVDSILSQNSIEEVFKSKEHINTLQCKYNDEKHMMDADDEITADAFCVATIAFPIDGKRKIEFLFVIKEENEMSALISYFNQKNNWRENKPEFATWGSMKYIPFGNILEHCFNCSNLRDGRQCDTCYETTCADCEKDFSGCSNSSCETILNKT